MPGLCGSGLARDGITAVRLKDRVACIASEPAPTGEVPALYCLRHLLPGPESQVVHQFCQRQRLADEVALHLVAAKITQKRKLLRGFGAFGNHFQFQVVRQVDHGMHQLAVLFAAFHAAHKAFVDLEQRYGQAVEVHKR